MRAISLWQPWASLPFTFYKKYETRHWPTAYRGPLAIHAAQKLVIDLDPLLQDILVEQFGPLWARTLPRGVVVGVVQLTGCQRTESLHVDPIEQRCGDWTPGRYAWRLEAPRLFDTPIAAKGRQGFFNWHDPVGPASPPEPERLL